MATLGPPPPDEKSRGRWLQQLWDVLRGQADLDASLGAVVSTDGTQTLTNKTLTQEDWTEVSAFANSWENYDTGHFEPAAYFKDSCGMVHLKGLIKNGGVGFTSAANIFTLPAGYRPPLGALFAVFSNDVFGAVEVFPDGVVRARVGSSTSFSLEGITFRAA